MPEKKVLKKRRKAIHIPLPQKSYQTELDFNLL
jgi:hypothetical protein